MVGKNGKQENIVGEINNTVLVGLLIEYILGKTSANITINIVIIIVAYKIPFAPNKSYKKAVASEDAKILTRLNKK